MMTLEKMAQHFDKATYVQFDIDLDKGTRLTNMFAGDQLTAEEVKAVDLHLQHLESWPMMTDGYYQLVLSAERVLICVLCPDGTRARIKGFMIPRTTENRLAVIEIRQGYMAREYNRMARQQAGGAFI